ncbi:MAG: hypothetical protein AAGD12_13465 [Pseudomonadota bacterium]
MTKAVALALSLALPAGVAAIPAAAEIDPPFAVAPIIECRARAIAQLNLADWEEVAVGQAATQAILEQANMALILGLWGAPLDNVEAATEDMAEGERLLLQSATLINRYAAEWPQSGPYDGELVGCMGIVWGAAKAVIDELFDQSTPRAR